MLIVTVVLQEKQPQDLGGHKIISFYLAHKCVSWQLRLGLEVVPWSLPTCSRAWWFTADLLMGSGAWQWPLTSASFSHPFLGPVNEPQPVLVRKRERARPESVALTIQMLFKFWPASLCWHPISQNKGSLNIRIRLGEALHARGRGCRKRGKNKANFAIDPVNKVNFQFLNKGELENIIAIQRDGVTVYP